MKAIALVSGGLDSILAAKLVKELGIEVIPLHFTIPFCHRAKKDASSTRSLPKFILDNLGVELKEIGIKDTYLEIIKKPAHGFGSNMNPCIDCKILMLKNVKELMKELDAGFVITGEVLGQRPMSQHRQALSIIAKKSGLEGLVLRPLSAQLLDETIPEKEGWVSRDKLLNFGGRGRLEQVKLAGVLGIKDFAQPAGGCLLTDPEFAKRLKELIDHGELDLDNIELLKVGRHLRLAQNAKLVVGRNEGENEELMDLAKEGDHLFMPNDLMAGPTSLGRGAFSDELIKLGCAITCRYCDIDSPGEAGIIWYRKGGEEKCSLNVPPAKDAEFAGFRI